MNLREARKEIATLKRENCFNPMKQCAAEMGLPLSFVCAIASRETNCVNLLGDYREGQYHGVGVMQIDIQHEIAQKALADGSWKANPSPLIEYGCEILHTDLNEVASLYPSMSGPDRLRFVAASYNAGFENAKRGHEAGNCDAFTTGRNYGADVVSRQACFSKVLGAAT